MGHAIRRLACGIIMCSRPPLSRCVSGDEAHLPRTNGSRMVSSDYISIVLNPNMPRQNVKLLVVKLKENCHADPLTSLSLPFLFSFAMGPKLSLFWSYLKNHKVEDSKGRTRSGFGGSWVQRGRPIIWEGLDKIGFPCWSGPKMKPLSTQKKSVIFSPSSSHKKRLKEALTMGMCLLP